MKINLHSLPCLFVCLALLMTSAFSSATQESDDDQGFVEYHISRHLFEGQKDGQPLCLFLEQIGPNVLGQLWPSQASCDTQTAPVNLLQGLGLVRGTWDSAGHILLTIETMQDTEIQSATWRLVAQTQEGGRLISLQAADTPSSLLFQEIKPASGAPRLPYRMAIVMTGSISDPRACDDDPPTITAIRLYREQELVQELATESDGTCAGYTPQTADLNFDGYDDLMIMTSLPISPNIPYQYWLYNPQTGLFEDAPQSLQMVTSPGIDSTHQQIYSFWRAGATSHGVDVYRWQTRNSQPELELFDQASSYFMPVRSEGQISYCYTTPQYDHDTGTLAFSRMVVEHPDGSLAYTGQPQDMQDCEDEFISSPAPEIVIWRQTPQGWQIQKTYPYEWVQEMRDGSSYWYPKIPYYDTDAHRIGWYIDHSAELDANPLAAHERE